MYQEKRVKVSIILLGSSGCGKSSIVTRWTKPFKIPQCSETIAIDVVSHSVILKQVHYLIRMWDTAGADYYDDLLERYVYNSDCACVVFDVTSISSWEKAKYWVEKINCGNNGNVPICLISNKIDLESKRKIHKKDVIHFINTLGSQNIIHSETSATTGENVKATYQLVVDYCKKPIREYWNSRDISSSSESKCIIV